MYLTRFIVIILFIIVGISCNYNKNTQPDNNIIVHAIRLKPGEDLKQSLEKFVKEKGISAGWLSTCAGSLTNYSIRFANQPHTTVGRGHFEIVSLTGTLSTSGSHIHLSISDSTGKTIGGHLMEGCKIYTTAEIVLQSSENYIFSREKDGTTPWEELQIKLKQ